MLTQDQLFRLVDEMVEFQHTKVLNIAREYYPGLTHEDIRNPQDYPLLSASHRFNFEDGILSGYLGMRMAILAEIRLTEKQDI